MSQACLFDKFVQPTTAGTDIIEPPIVYHECSMKILDENEEKAIEMSRRFSVKPIMTGKKDRMKKVFNVLEVAVFSGTDDECFPCENHFNTEQEAQDYMISEIDFANYCKSRDLVWDGRRYMLKEVDGELVRWHGDDADKQTAEEERGLVLG